MAPIEAAPAPREAEDLAQREAEERIRLRGVEEMRRKRAEEKAKQEAENRASASHGSEAPQGSEMAPVVHRGPKVFESHAILAQLCPPEGSLVLKHQEHRS